MELAYNTTSVSTRNVYYKPIDDIYSFYEDVVLTTCKDTKQKTVKKGLALTENILAVTNMEPVDTNIPVCWMRRKVGSIMPVRKKLLDNIMSGHNHIGYIFKDDSVFIQYNYENYKVSASYEYNPEEYEYLIVNSCTYEYAKLDMSPLAVPHKIDYTDAFFTDIHFDLKSALQYIKEHTDKFCPVYYENMSEICIETVPDYSPYIGRFHIPCLYMLSDEEAEAVKGKTTYEKNKFLINSSGLAKFRK